jgi:hypothetical protein
VGKTRVQLLHKHFAQGPMTFGLQEIAKEANVGEKKTWFMSMIFTDFVLLVSLSLSPSETYMRKVTSFV